MKQPIKKNSNLWIAIKQKEFEIKELYKEYFKLLQEWKNQKIS